MEGRDNKKGGLKVTVWLESRSLTSTRQTGQKGRTRKGKNETEKAGTTVVGGKTGKRREGVQGRSAVWGALPIQRAKHRQTLPNKRSSHRTPPPPPYPQSRIPRSQTHPPHLDHRPPNAPAPRSKNATSSCATTTENVEGGSDTTGEQRESRIQYGKERPQVREPHS